jgi:hypothetical protein
MTRMTLMHELSDRGPLLGQAAGHLAPAPDAHLLRRRSLREVLADRRAARATRRTSRHRRRWPTRTVTGWSPSRWPARRAGR